MAITLNVLEPCHNCPDFEPIKTNAFNVMCWDEVIARNCTVTCEHIDRCKVLLEHMSKEVKKNGK